MPRVKLAVGGWFGGSCAIAALAWACSGKDNDLFSDPSRGGQTSTGGSGTAGDGITGGTSGSSGTSSGGSGGSSSGGVATGGMSQTGGTSGEGGAAAESGTDSGGTTTGGMGGTGLTSGAGGAGTSGSGGASAAGGAGAGGAGTGGAGTGGAGTGGAGTGGTGGMPPRTCSDDDDCDDANNADYCKKSSCGAAMGTCVPLGPPCVGDNAVFEPVCGCDGITYWNTCAISHEGFNIASMGECTGNNRPTCTRDEGPDSCPDRAHVHCYRPVEVCGDPSPDEGFCWVLPTECPDDEPQTERYCGGTGGLARCIGLCEVIDAENSFRRDAPTCD